MSCWKRWKSGVFRSICKSSWVYWARRMVGDCEGGRRAMPRIGCRRSPSTSEDTQVSTSLNRTDILTGHSIWLAFYRHPRWILIKLSTCSTSTSPTFQAMSISPMLERPTACYISSACNKTSLGTCEGTEQKSLVGISPPKPLGGDSYLHVWS